jgi:hypothetical protein
MTDRAPPLWEPLPGEPARWYGRFERFRLAGPTRSLLATFNAEQSERQGTKRRCVPGAWVQAACRWRWRERAAAWDDHDQRQARAAHAAKVNEMNERHVQAARGLQAKALERLRALRPEELQPAHVLRYLAEAAKLERTALGESEEVRPPEPAVGHDGDGGPLHFTLEDALAAARELEEAEHDALRRDGGAAPPPRSDQVP